MHSLSQKRCFNHAEREAAARCLECGQFFCRECASEHDGRILCSACLTKKGHKREKSAPFTLSKQAVIVLKGISGILLAWFLFWLFGLLVLAITE
ncbi:MAG: rhomboid family protein [Verrucomicrobiota bacterium]|nr:rhomboid family protein [Verrucomicrobiota bacterium]